MATPLCGVATQTNKLFNRTIFSLYVRNFPRIKENRSIISYNPPNITLHSLLTHRKFDMGQDFVILPYYPLDSSSVRNMEENPFFSELCNHIEDVTYNLRQNKIQLQNLTKIDKIISNLINPLHLTHPLLATSPGHEIVHDHDMEKLIVKCGRTVFVQKMEIIDKEFIYFKRNYDSINFFK